MSVHVPIEKNKFSSLFMGFFLIRRLLWFHWVPAFLVLGTQYQEQHVDSIWNGALGI